MPKFGRWQVVKRLGRGGNGVVWEATDPDTGAVAAVKTLTPQAQQNRERRARFEDEIAFLLANPDFPGIVPIIDHDQGEDAIRWYAMRLVRPVRQALGGDPPIETVVKACHSFAATLAELAAQATHHRDVKPDNLFEDSGDYLVGDFGLVFYPDKTPVTRHGRRVGPVDYMAPEMRDAADTADAEKADVWSLGKTLWVLLTGADLPQPGPHRIDDAAYALAVRLEHPRVRELDLLLERMTRIDPVQRPSMAKARDELDAWLTPTPAITVPEVGRRRETITAHTAASVRAQEREGELRRAENDAMRGLEQQGLSVVHNQIIGQTAGLNTTYGAGERGRLTPQGDWLVPDAFHCSGWQSEAATLSESPIRLFSSVAACVTTDAEVTVSASLVVVRRPLGPDPEQRFVHWDTATAPAGSSELHHAIARVAQALIDATPQALEAVVAWLRESGQARDASA